MEQDDAEARKARAERLRARIDGLTAPGEQDPEDEQQAPESARDFVERRMRELDDDEEDVR